MPLPSLDGGPNLAYMGQWLIFAVSESGLYWVLLRRNARGSAEVEAAPLSLMDIYIATSIHKWIGDGGSAEKSPLIGHGFSIMTALIMFCLLAARGHFRVRMMSEATARVSAVTSAVASGMWRF